MNCLRKANTSAILEGFREVYKDRRAQEEFWFSPNVDGEGGLVPDLPSRLSTDIQLPFIAGTNLDEGGYYANLTKNRRVIAYFRN